MNNIDEIESESDETIENSNSYKDLDQLRNEIYSVAIDNIKDAKKLYKKLFPDKSDINILVVTSEQAINCLRVIRENTDTLIKLYSEVGKKSGNAETGFLASVIYEKLNEITDPYKERKKISTQINLIE